jgi:hypothetical protein
MGPARFLPLRMAGKVRKKPRPRQKESATVAAIVAFAPK